MSFTKMIGGGGGLNNVCILLHSILPDSLKDVHGHCSCASIPHMCALIKTLNKTA